MFFNMFLIYNTIVHWSIFPINGVIIIKEVQLQFFEFLNAFSNHDPDYKITKEEAEHTFDFWSDDWALSPVTWYKRAKQSWNDIFNKRSTNYRWNQDYAKQEFKEKWEEDHKRDMDKFINKKLQEIKNE